MLIYVFNNEGHQNHTNINLVKNYIYITQNSIGKNDLKPNILEPLLILMIEYHIVLMCIFISIVISVMIWNKIGIKLLKYIIQKFHIVT